MVTLEDIKEAQRNIKDYIHKTPLVYSNSISSMTGLDVYLKLENLQKTGSFKIRGATNKISRMSADERKRGVVTASAGNHAQGVALSANRFGIKATVVMPEKSSISKQLATKGYGAEVILYGNSFDDALQHARTIEKDRGCIFIHTYDDEDLIAGQGTIGLEILDELPDVNSVIVPIGGGSLISGISIALKEQKGDIQIIGVEASAAAAMYKSRQKGKNTPVDSLQTIADGIAIKRIGDLTFPIIQELVDEIVTVEDEDIAAAILLLMERKKTVVEGAGAAPIAAIMNGRAKIQGKKVVLVLSGGNIDMNILERVIEKGLVKAGRVLRVEVEMDDAPDAIARLTSLIAEKKANILHIVHDRLSRRLPVMKTLVELSLETKGFEHNKEIMDKLIGMAYKARVI
ncbi:MAG: threonine ammonia-lyase [Nitrospinae bacterium]|nr:threonine ammonia-lyase [Nitrospinota bacterium]MBI3813818.1 threonine ammonia-lyase [Nitrospinota bacterium]